MKESWEFIPVQWDIIKDVYNNILLNKHVPSNISTDIYEGAFGKGLVREINVYLIIIANEINHSNMQMRMFETWAGCGIINLEEVGWCLEEEAESYSWQQERCWGPGWNS